VHNEWAQGWDGGCNDDDVLFDCEPEDERDCFVFGLSASGECGMWNGRNEILHVKSASFPKSPSVIVLTIEAAKALDFELARYHYYRCETDNILIPIRMLRTILIRKVMLRSFRTDIGRNVKIRSCMQFKAILVSSWTKGVLT
jgi:hypothetical protein